MRRTLVLASVLSFASAFLGSVLAFSLVGPGRVDAQEARIRAEQFTLVGDNGADRIRLQTGPGLSAGAYLLDASGERRVQLSTGAPTLGAGGNPDAMGLNLNAADGNTTLARIGTINQPDGTVGGMRMFLSDQQGNRRVDIMVAEDGTPSIRLLDADGTVRWSAS